MTTVPNGLLGGLLVGLLASVVVQLVGADQSATVALLERVSGSGVPSWWAVVVQVLYGSLAGGVLVALELNVFGLVAVPAGRGEVLGITLAGSALL